MNCERKASGHSVLGSGVLVLVDIVASGVCVLVVSASGVLDGPDVGSREQAESVRAVAMEARTERNFKVFITEVYEGGE